MKPFSRLMLAAGASSMAILPVAAEAGTRASKSSASVSAPGTDRAAKGDGQSEEDDRKPGFWILGGLAVGAIVGGIVTASNNGRPGGCKSPGC